VIYGALRGDWPHVLELGRGQLQEGLVFMGGLILRVATRAAFVLAFFGVLDYVLQKRKLTKRMMMTLEEVKREMKEDMPSPEMKAKRRALQKQMAKNKVVSAVQGADVILVNPTHYAVALKYQPGKGGAPKVVAKGVDHLALRIREIATDAKVPIVQNIPLARALYAQVKVGRDIPVELYKAVAEVLATVYKKRKPTRQGAARV
jgi:flagellar biosynthetic protein FlhB